MVKFILGKKIGMTRRFRGDGAVIPVTRIEAGPCMITQVNTPSHRRTQGSVQLGFQKKRRLTKPLEGHLQGLEHFRYLREFRCDQPEQFHRGEKIGVSMFRSGDKVRVTGVSKGKGFQGVVKRHGFRGSPASHGHKDQLRMPGSIGSTFPQHVLKGKRMAGRMGGERTTVQNLEVIDVIPERNELIVKGAVPGAVNALLLIVAKEQENQEREQ